MAERLTVSLHSQSFVLKLTVDDLTFSTDKGQ